MQAKLNDEKKAAETRYYELVAALEAMNKAQQNLLFDIQPNETLFKKLNEQGQVAPLYVEFVSKNSGAKFTIENKFFPHSWVVTTPENATKEELDYVRDLTLEAIAHPQNAPEGYQPKLLAFFPDNTPPEQIREFIKSAEEKGIEVNLFIGKKSEYDKISQEHSQKTREAIESGNRDKLPGWDGYMKMISRSDGGKKGQEMLRELHAEPTSSLSNN
ncbi:hypothetical protein DGG96_13135 [Legionella qingyii]|uniref:Uncharacterized protein n=1 Tax=Legionella qingyii TaxID=2184757 RepID=A0A317TZV9_9GAMM|nr:hypothetical protein [Legionella qingyii]PWY55121.1 hypothetical protein DGG96_13135 [Legionella qingyii]RUR25456.1 hypothetical protein ELY20_03080 [Legionella qingyii]RUR28434.1 hypothetical protein ELY16_02930 [Legionella qingyii]